MERRCGQLSSIGRCPTRVKIGVPTRWSSFVARAHYLSWVLLIAARMSRTKEPDALGSMVSCALILASILTQGHELWPRSLKLPSLPSQPVILTKPSHTSVQIFPPGSKVAHRPHSATARRNRIRSARIEGTPPHASYARIPRAPRRAADRSSDSELRSESEKSERKQGETSGDTRVRVNRDGAAPIGQR